jgi:PAS domain S-box-containing protein
MKSKEKPNMADARKTKAQLLTELTALRQKVAELEKSQIEQKPFANMGNVREANRNLEITIQSSPLAIIVVDNEDKVRVWNPAAEHMFGWKQQEVMGQSIPTIPDNEKDEFNRIRKPVDQQQVVAIQRTRRRKKDGSVIDVSISVAPVTDTDGHVIGRMGILADITEHVRAEENLRESEEKFRSILEIIDEGYYELDLAGNITFFNKSLPIILGYPEEEMKGLNYCQYMDEKNIKKAFKIYNDVYHTGKLARLRRGEIRRKDGNKIFVELSISLMRDSSGNHRTQTVRGRFVCCKGTLPDPGGEIICRHLCGAGW